MGRNKAFITYHTLQDDIHLLQSLSAWCAVMLGQFLRAVTPGEGWLCTVQKVVSWPIYQPT